MSVLLTEHGRYFKHKDEEQKKVSLRGQDVDDDEHC